MEADAPPATCSQGGRGERGGTSVATGISEGTVRQTDALCIAY